MARIPRWTQKIFASGASNNGIFGSGQLGTKVLSNSLSDIQSLAAWTSGWLSATVGALKFPPLEEMQAVQYLTTTQLAYLFQQGIPEYDAGTNYFSFSLVMNPSTYQLYGSLVDNNLGHALSDATKWQFLIDFSNTSPFTTGDGKLTMKSTADIGWVLCNDGTIGNAASGGTTRANADTAALFTLLWTNFADAQCPVSTGRGGSAAADFAANKNIKLPLQLGRALAIAGAGAGLTSRAMGFAFGEETHLLTTPEIPSHNHSLTDPTHLHDIPQQNNLHAGVVGSDTWYAGAGLSTSPASTGITINNTGGGGAHNNIQPTGWAWNVMVKL